MVISVSNRRQWRGFSLLEMLLVLVLVAAGGMLAAANLSGGLDGMRLRSATRDIVTGLRHARAQAIASGQMQQVEIDPAARAWAAGAGPAQHGQWHESLRVRFTGARELEPRAGAGVIVFFADGASSGGRIELMRGTAVMRIDVAWLTGEVRVRRGEEG